MKKVIISIVLLSLAFVLLVSCSSTSYFESEIEVAEVQSYFPIYEEPIITECKRHDYNIEYVYPKTCSEVGYTLMTCNVCGHQEVVNWDKSNPNNLNHNYEVIEKVCPSHCEEVGYTLMKCKVCGEIKKVETIKEHDYHIIEKKEHTCYDSGYIKKECSVCGKVSIEYIPAGHTFIWEETSFIDYYREYCVDCHKYSGRVKDHGIIYQI